MGLWHINRTEKLSHGKDGIMAYKQNRKTEPWEGWDYGIYTEQKN